MSEDPNQTLIDEVQHDLVNESDSQEGRQDQREDNVDVVSGEPISDGVAGSMWI